MNINHTNKQPIHDVLIKDMQARLFKQYNEYLKHASDDNGNTILTDEDYDNALSKLVNEILHCNSINDINELLVTSTDLFTSYEDINVFTLDGTLNYVLSLLIESCKVNVEPV
tara:strand:- start:241 stop:579 length:339 start_codon:yes stop_codon:yes gene_type:complete